MKQRFLLAALSLTVTVALPAGAQIIFEAFSGNAAVPDAKAEDAKVWVANNVSKGKNAFSVANGILSQTANECGLSTPSIFPGLENAKLRDVVVSADVKINDDDAIGFVVRFEAMGAHYSAVVTGADPNLGNKWFLHDSGATVDQCFVDGPNHANALASDLMNPPFTQGQWYTMVVRAVGNKIELYWGPETSRASILAGKYPPLIGEATDSKHDAGTVGLFAASCPVDFKTILVQDANLAVEANGKLAASWGELKSSR